MSETAYCYHCAIHHPISEMREILTKGGKRWRCIKSIEAAKAEIGKRDAFGLQMSDVRKTQRRSEGRARWDAESGAEYR
jgi:hypothetical protein